MPHEGDSTWEPRYGMDSGGDGVDAAELAAYYDYKAQKEKELATSMAQDEAARAQLKAQNATDYETVPGFKDKRSSHMTGMNDHNYAEPLTQDKAVFPFFSISHGPMAKLLSKTPGKKESQEPRGRSRSGMDFFAPPTVV